AVAASWQPARRKSAGARVSRRNPLEACASVKRAPERAKGPNRARDIEPAARIDRQARLGVPPCLHADDRRPPEGPHAALPVAAAFQREETRHNEREDRSPHPMKRHAEQTHPAPSTLHRSLGRSRPTSAPRTAQNPYNAGMAGTSRDGPTTTIRSVPLSRIRT